MHGPLSGGALCDLIARAVTPNSSPLELYALLQAMGPPGVAASCGRAASAGHPAGAALLPISNTTLLFRLHAPLTGKISMDMT
jgi:hypothetical protein